MRSHTGPADAGLVDGSCRRAILREASMPAPWGWQVRAQDRRLVTNVDGVSPVGRTAYRCPCLGPGCAGQTQFRSDRTGAGRISVRRAGYAEDTGRSDGGGIPLAIRAV